LVMRKEPLQELSVNEEDISVKPMAVLFFLTKLENSPCLPKLDY
jgi:hypothetical protein